MNVKSEDQAPESQWVHKSSDYQAKGNLMNRESATHTGPSGVHLYRIAQLTFWERLNPLITGVEFWDTYTYTWCVSIMRKSELVALTVRGKS